VGANPTRRTLQPEATGAVMEVTKWVEHISLFVAKLNDRRSRRNKKGGPKAALSCL
jgi:hypothetical protein